MRINWEKSFFMIFSNPHMKKSPPLTSINCGTFTIQSTSSFKYLGVWLDEHLSFDVHVQKMINKINPRIYFISRLKRYIPMHKWAQVVRAIIISSLEYGIQVWGGSSHVHKVQKCLDNFLLRLHKPYRFTLGEIYENFKILKMEEFSTYYLLDQARYYFLDCMQVNIPSALHAFLHKQTLNRTTRSQFYNNFARPEHEKTFYEKSVKFRMYSNWNRLPNKIKNTESRVEFRYELNQYLIKNRK
jgi:hypothetical protein